MRLLVAVTGDNKGIWEAQAFDFSIEKLRGKHLDKISADNVIAVMAEHFTISTMTAEQEAHRVFRGFCGAFLDVKKLFLPPSAFLNRKGFDITGTMYCNLIPENVCHLGVYACIPMRSLIKALGQS